MSDTDIISQVDRGYDCICFGITVINTPPKIIIAYTISIIVLVYSIAIMLLNMVHNNYVPDTIILSIFLPQISFVIGFWMPSPNQSSLSRKDALQNSQLVQGNLQFVSKYTQGLQLVQPQHVDQPQIPV